TMTDGSDIGFPTSTGTPRLGCPGVWRPDRDQAPERLRAAAWTAGSARKRPTWNQTSSAPAAISSAHSPLPGCARCNTTAAPIVSASQAQACQRPTSARRVSRPMISRACAGGIPYSSLITCGCIACLAPVDVRNRVPRGYMDDVGSVDYATDRRANKEIHLPTGGETQGRPGGVAGFARGSALLT